MGCSLTKKDSIEDSLAPEFVRACLVTQRFYRATKAKKQLRRLAIWQLFQYIDFNKEQDQVEMYNVYNSLLQNIPKVGDPNIDTKSPDYKVKVDIQIYEEPTFSNSKSLIIHFPITTIEVQKLISFFHKKNVPVLHPKYVCPILRLAAMHLKGLKNFNTPNLKRDDHITVCGDLHGSLTDLLVVFHKNGLPSSNNPYVFNGNLVDYGKNGMEVLLLLLACFLANPHAVYFNRGNHEDMVMNKRYGFLAEVSQKYGRNAPNIVYLIENVYRWLPLGTIVYDRVLIVHGGISINTDWLRLQKIDRGLFQSILRPPFHKTFETADWRQSFDLLWSDPQEMEGCQPNTARGDGMFFGPDITAQFLKRNNFTLLVRSHQCKPDGFELTHNNKLVTVFSHANYFAIGSNKGAYLRLYDDVRLHFVRFITSASRIKDLKDGEILLALEKAALIKLGVRLQKKLKKLEKEFHKYDIDDTGNITSSQWSDAMLHVSQMAAPWYILAERFGKKTRTKEGKVYINYKTTLELLSSEDVKLEYAKIQVNSEAVRDEEENLITIFEILDKDNSGTITAEEFVMAWELVESFLPSKRKRGEILKWFALMDYDKDGEINLEEFLEAFRLCDEYRTDLVVPHKRITKASISELKDEPSSADDDSSLFSSSSRTYSDKATQYTRSEDSSDTDAKLTNKK